MQFDVIMTLTILRFFTFSSSLYKTIENRSHSIDSITMKKKLFKVKLQKICFHDLFKIHLIPGFRLIIFSTAIIFNYNNLKVNTTILVTPNTTRTLQSYNKLVLTDSIDSICSQHTKTDQALQQMEWDTP